MRGAVHRRGPAARPAVAALAVAALAAAAGCGTGQLTQTDATVPSVPGADRQIEVPGGRLGVRNAVIVYPGTGGYRRGAMAPLDIRIFNDTDKPVRLTGVTSPSGRVVLAGGASPASPGASPSRPTHASPPRSPTPSPPRSPTPSPSRSPTPSPAGAPVNVEVPAGGFVVLSPEAGRFLQLVGLTDDLLPGESVAVTFRFDNGAVMQDVAVPLDIPLSPAARSPIRLEEGEEGEAGHG